MGDIDIVVQLRAHDRLVAEAREMIGLPVRLPGEGLWTRAADEIDALRARADRAEARAAKWKADAEQLAAHYRDDIRYAERVYGPQEWRGRADDGALTLHAALAAEDADEGSGT